MINFSLDTCWRLIPTEAADGEVRFAAFLFAIIPT